MKAAVVELVFVVDASESMRPCYEALASNLESFLKPLQGNNLNVRLGLVAHKVGRSQAGGGVVFIDTLAGNMSPVYQAGNQAELFTGSPDRFLKRLREVSLSGDENNLFGLDIAADHPFGAIGKTRRVVAMFSDEAIEDGFLSLSGGGKTDIELLPDLVQKLSARRLMLFAAMPNSPALEMLGSLDGSQIQAVSGGDGLASVDFGSLMRQMAKSISVSSLQGEELEYRRALFGQDAWGTSDSNSFEGMR